MDVLSPHSCKHVGWGGGTEFDFLVFNIGYFLPCSCFAVESKLGELTNETGGLKKQRVSY